MFYYIYNNILNYDIFFIIDVLISTFCYMIWVSHKDY